jgi:hypothetical protein
MRGARLELVGQVFERLTVEARSAKPRYWVCRCICGTMIETRGSRLTDGTTRSCGCLRQSHGHTAGKMSSPTYLSWKAMKARCRNSRVSSHGALGIGYIDGWEDFSQFLKDMGERPNKTSLDRIDVFGHYTPKNCRWATDLVQANNKRKTKTLYYDFENYGPEGSPAEWARYLRSKTNNEVWTVPHLNIVLKTLTLDQIIGAINPYSLTPQELRDRKAKALESNTASEVNRLLDEMLMDSGQY